MYLNRNYKILYNCRHSTRIFKITVMKARVNEMLVDAKTMLSKTENNYCRSLYILVASDIVQILSVVTLVFCT